ncbi:MAG: AAA family ATPase [Actinomycetota bacterium]|nr:AAA family ATPase [Actinomycetota bacterium]
MLTSPLVLGRNAELAELADGFRQAVAGRGRLFLISGEPGIGKTTLAEAFAASSIQDGALALWGRCWESGGAPAFWPWIQALRSALSVPQVRDIVHSLGAAGGLVERFAGTGVLHPGDASPNQAEAEQARFALFDAVTQSFQQVSARTPLVVVLDDLHAADLPTLLLLKFVARHLRDTRAVLVGVYREAEARRNPQVGKELGDIAREGSTVELRGLDREALARLMERTIGAPPSSAVVEAVASLTRGNPLFAHELARVLAREGRIDADEVELSVSLAVDEGLPQTVRRRLDRVPQRLLKLLEVASVLGRDFSMDLLAEVVSEDRHRIRQLLDTAVEEGLVEEVSVGGGRFRFAHGLFRDGLYQAMDPERRRQLHRGVGEALERLHSGDLDAYLREIAHHFVNAGISNAANAYDYTLRAARRADRLLAFEEAVDLYEQALELIGPAGVDSRSTGDVLVALGEARLRAGRIDHAVATFKQAAELAREAQAWELFGRAAAGLGEKPVEGGVVDAELVGLIEEALAHLSGGYDELRSMLMARLALEFSFSPDTERRHLLAGEAVAMARQSASPRALAAALRAATTALLGPDTGEECFAAGNELLELGRRTKDWGMQALGYVARMNYLLERGRVDEFSQHIDQLEHVARASRQSIHVWAAAVTKATRALIRGEFEDAERLSLEALQINPELPNAMNAHFTQTGILKWHQGQLADTEPMLRLVRDSRPGLYWGWTASLALVLAETGRHEEARGELTTIVEALEEIPRDMNWLPAVSGSAHICYLIDASDLAPPLYQALVPYADRFAVSGRPRAGYWGSVALRLAQLADVMGLDEAEERFKRALEAERRITSWPFLAHAEATYAAMLVERGRSGDREQARRLLASAAATADRLVMPPLQQKVEAVGKRLAELPEVLPAPSPSRPEFRKEGEYWTVEYDGVVSRFKDAKGLQYLDVLLRSPRQEHHVMDLLMVVEGHGSGSPHSGAARVGLTGSRPSHAGDVLDAQAKAAYKRRLDDLRDELKEAEAWGDPERVSRARDEMDFLAHELASAVGLRGRARQAASPVEHARVSVTKAIRASVTKITQANPGLGRHFRATIKTGTYCSYGRGGETLPDWRFGPAG